jgi:PKD repeat protein
MTYNIGIGTTKNLFNISPAHSSTSGYRKVPAMGNAQLDTSQVFKNLVSQKYYWSVQAVDQTMIGGAWAAIDSFIVKNTQAFFTYDTVCHGYPTHFTDQSVATDGIASRKWDFTDGSTSTLQNPVHQFAAGGTYNVKLVVTSTTGAKDSLITPVIVKKRASTGFTAPNTCQGTATIITNTTNVNGLTISSWYWDFGDGTFSVAQQPPAHGYLGPGDYPVLLKALAANGCIDSTIKTVSVVAKPAAAISTSTPLSFCEGDSVILSVTKSSVYSYEWSLNGTKQVNGDSSKFVAKFPGEYKVKVSNKTVTNCETTSNPETVTIKPNPFKPAILSENYTDKICPGDKQIRLYVDQPVTGYNYQWFRNGSPISGATSSSYQDYLDAGDYKVEASLTGCRSSSDIKKLEFPDAPPKPVLFTQNGPNVWYLVSSVNNAANYRWYFNGAVIPGATTYLYVAGKNFGKYYIVISNEKGCYVRSDEITIPTGTTAIEDIDPFESLNIYPNPSNGLVNIEMSNQIFDDIYISVVSQSGKEVMKMKLEKTTNDFTWQLDLTRQARGVYFISLSLDKYKSNKKVIIK